MSPAIGKARAWTFGVLTTMALTSGAVAYELAASHTAAAPASATANTDDLQTPVPGSDEGVQPAPPNQAQGNLSQPAPQGRHHGRGQSGSFGAASPVQPGQGSGQARSAGS